MARAHEAPAFLGAVKILHEPLSFEFPDTFPELLAALSAQHVSGEDLLEQLAQVWLANELAAVRHGRPGPASRPPRRTDARTRRVRRPARYAPGGLAARSRRGGHPRHPHPGQRPGPRAGRLASGRTEAGARVVADRPPRLGVCRGGPAADRHPPRFGKTAQWLLGKSVLVLGCGALGARIAEHCVRAGARRLVVADRDLVGPGVLVRQPYEDADIGLPKARQLAERLTEIRPSGVEVAAELGDVRDTMLGSDASRPEADLIVDATANRGVSARIEWLRRTQPGRWPPILTVGVGHACERVVGALALPHASGAGADILHSFADQAVRDEALRDAAEDFFADPGPGSIFQPEIGCSEPTFTGSDPEVAAAAGQVFSWGLRVLNDHAAHRPVSPKSLFLARLPGDPRRAAHVYLEWPNDVAADDERSGYQVRIRPQAMARMRAEALRTARRFPRRWETGGVLLGYFDDACRVAWVTAAEPPPPDSVRGEHAFRHGTEGVAGPHRPDIAGPAVAGSASSACGTRTRAWRPGPA